jgi:hypothetical protein
MYYFLSMLSTIDLGSSIPTVAHVGYILVQCQRDQLQCTMAFLSLKMEPKSKSTTCGYWFKITTGLERQVRRLYNKEQHQSSVCDALHRKWLSVPQSNGKEKKRGGGGRQAEVYETWQSFQVGFGFWFEQVNCRSAQMRQFWGNSNISWVLDVSHMKTIIKIFRCYKGKDFLGEIL